MGTFTADIKHLSHVSPESRLYHGIAISALALGIGANTAIFSVIDAVILKPLPFPDADRIVALMNSSPQGSGPAASVPKYNVWRKQTQALEDTKRKDTVEGSGLNLSGGDRPGAAKGHPRSHEFFRLRRADGPRSHLHCVRGRSPTRRQSGRARMHLAAPLRVRRFHRRQGHRARRRIVYDYRRARARLCIRSTVRSLSAFSSRPQQH